MFALQPSGSRCFSHGWTKDPLVKVCGLFNRPALLQFSSLRTSDSTHFLTDDAGNPQQSVALGTLNAALNLPAGLPATPVVTPFGLGPYRLMYLAQANDALFIVDTRHANSIRNLAVQQNGTPAVRTFEGF